MEIKNFVLGGMSTNAYLVWENKQDATLFDIGGENLKPLIDFLEENEIVLKRVVFTHGHYDHIGGLMKLLEYKMDIDLYIGYEDKEFLYNSNLSLSSQIMGSEFKLGKDKKIITLKEGDTVSGFFVIDTPGHTKGSKCFYNEANKVMISGDTLFNMGYGRVDLPTGSYEDIVRSLNKICKNYPAETIVYPGHNGMTKLGVERKNLFGE